MSGSSSRWIPLSSDGSTHRLIRWSTHAGTRTPTLTNECWLRRSCTAWYASNYIGALLFVPGPEHGLRIGVRPGVPVISATSDLISSFGGTEATLFGPSQKRALILEANSSSIDDGLIYAVRLCAEWCKGKKAAVVNEEIDELLETSRCLRSVFPFNR